VTGIRGYVFDAYGTLFDVHAVVEAGRAITTDPLAGARAFGYQVAWCNRLGAPKVELGMRADLVIGRLAELPR
jgi:hypothetical protein